MFTAIALLTTTIFSGYFYLIISYLISWRQLKVFETDLHDYNFKTTVSIVVAARNEDQNISYLLNVLVLQTYPKSLLEIIIVDDHSDDNTIRVVEDFISNHQLVNIKLLQLRNLNPQLKNKKAAISEAIKIATGALIITTDADCTMSSKWLATLVSYFEMHQPKLMVGPVMLEGNSILEHLQTVEFLSLMAITGASIKMNKPLMCNGANLAYPKSVYEAVNGFEGNETVASGDDTFLMLKINKKFNGGIHFIKSAPAIVKTGAQKTIPAFINQRVRWASKTNNYQDKYINAIGMLIFVANQSLLGLSFLFFFDFRFLKILMLALIFKLCADILLIISSNALFKTSKVNPFNVILLTIIYPFYFLIIMLKKSSGYNWKGREL
jgi:cellulose synthase/poly-beta-1,6-N-acetylglucosamine synthase-like glycosyltransferase